MKRPLPAGYSWLAGAGVGVVFWGVVIWSLIR